LKFNDAVDLLELATPPGTPAAGTIRYYAKSDGRLYTKDDTGVEYALSPDELTTFSRSGTLTTFTGAGRFLLPFAITILGVSAAVNTAPTGASIVVDVNKNGTSIFPSNPKPTILASAFKTAAEATPNTTAVASGDYLTCDVDQVGSSVAGADLTVVIRYRRA
jgi:hypothetical protein